MPTLKKIARSADDPLSCVDWQSDGTLSGTYATRRGDVTIRHGKFMGGSADGVQIIEVNTGASITWILPTRGFSIWRIEAGTLSLGWQSPVHGPVHPDRVPIDSADGLGWLEGFDELVVRCGLESNGAPEFTDSGTLKYPLHGRIANLPAEAVGLEVDPESGHVELSATMIEAKLFFKRLKLESRIRFTAGSAQVELEDDVTNELSTPATMQLLYHINVGSPLLGAGSRISATYKTLAPKNDHAAEEIDRWNTCDGPASGYAERVYFADAIGDETGHGLSMLQSPDGKQGLAVTFEVNHLPKLVFWKNTAALSDGYVVGLEPSTNFPNTRSFETSQGRVVKLGPGETKPFRVTLNPLASAEEVLAMQSQIDAVMRNAKSKIEPSAKSGWTPGA
jgi:Domain of unknown function (DUF4432)